MICRIKIDNFIHQRVVARETDVKYTIKEEKIT